MGLIEQQPPTSEAQALGSVRSAVTEARGLPNRFYVDSETFEREREVVFARNWAAVAFAHDVARAGSARPVELAGVPLILLRDHNGELRVFQNVCRHRGMALLSEPTRLKGALRCPYHSWCYALDGRLKATPHVGGPGHNTHAGIERDALGLIEVRSAVWMGVVFVNLSGTAPAFETYTQELRRRWRDFADRPLVHGGDHSTIEMELEANWKLAVENYCESYHLPWVHPGLNSYSRLQDHYNILAPGRYSGQGTTVYNPQLDAGGRRFATFADLPAQWNSGAEYVALYPNLLLGVHKDHVFAILVEPLTPERTRERAEIFYADAAMADETWRDMRQRNCETWRGVFEEDIFVVEGMQRGRHAPGFDGGKFSPAMDAATHCFHDWVAAQFEPQ